MTLAARGSGPQPFDALIPPGKSYFLVLKYGDYLIKVSAGDESLYNVRVKLNRPDKYEILLGENTAEVITP